eukprot:GHRR01014830.1.p6 GENE.GHRR01014830.1~~GHRR01014830.1.p6  ORF type:complete len:110 (-),score=20.22 GHRR01014830.1:1146-1475(-)
MSSSSCFSPEAGLLRPTWMCVKLGRWTPARSSWATWYTTASTTMATTNYQTCGRLKLKLLMLLSLDLAAASSATFLSFCTFVCIFGTVCSTNFAFALGLVEPTLSVCML